MKHYNDAESGFTLVELAISLMVIGLLIGGILRGQEMLNIAQMTRTMEDAKSFTAAVINFQDQYGGMPGDSPNATRRLPGCTAGNFCVDGDGNGRIGELTYFWDRADPAIASENVQFWKHLVLAKMIRGINPGSNTLNFGETHPTAAVGGGFTIIAASPSNVASLRMGQPALRVHGGLTDDNVETNPVVSPNQAGYIDRKSDDGLPATGNIRTKSYGNGAEVANCEQAYTSETRRLCTISFLLGL